MKDKIAKFDQFVLKHSMNAVREIESLPQEERQALAWIVVMAILLISIILKGIRLL